MPSPTFPKNGPAHDPYLDRLFGHRPEDDLPQEACAACGASFPASEAQAVGEDLFGPCCRQACQDCPEPATHMDGDEPVCEQCLAKRTRTPARVHPIFAGVLDAFNEGVK